MDVMKMKKKTRLHFNTNGSFFFVCVCSRFTDDAAETKFGILSVGICGG